MDTWLRFREALFSHYEMRERDSRGPKGRSDLVVPGNWIEGKLKNNTKGEVCVIMRWTQSSNRLKLSYCVIVCIGMEKASPATESEIYQTILCRSERQAKTVIVAVKHRIRYNGGFFFALASAHRGSMYVKCCKNISVHIETEKTAAVFDWMSLIALKIKKRNGG